MTLQRTALLVVVLTGAAFAAGYYFAPEKIKVETKLVEVVKKETVIEKEIEKNKHTETTTVEITRPDGTKEKTTTTKEDTTTGTTVTSNTNKSSTTTLDETRETSKNGRRYNLSLLAGADVTNDPLKAPIIYGGHISTNLIGPISIGVWGLTNKTFGASLGLAL